MLKLILLYGLANNLVQGARTLVAYSRSPDRLDVLGFTPDKSAVWNIYYDGSTWSPSNALTNLSTPAAGWSTKSDLSAAIATWINQPVQYIGLGRDDSAYLGYDQQWDASGYYGLNGQFLEAPVMVGESWYIRAIGRGSDRKYYSSAWANDMSFRGWENIDDTLFASRPYAISWRDYHYSVFGITSQGNVTYSAWMMGRYGMERYGWKDIGRPSGSIKFINDILVTSWDGGHFDVWATGNDNNLYLSTYSGSPWINEGNWTSWENLGTNSNLDQQAPTVVHMGVNRRDILILSSNGQYSYRTYDPDRGWWPSKTTWYPKKGATFTSLPAMVVRGGPENMMMFGIGTDGKLKSQAWNGTSAQWVPSFDTWNNLGDVNKLVQPSPSNVEDFTGDEFVVQTEF